MPSLWKHPQSQYFFACFTLPDGRRTKRSTKLTDRKKALKLAFEWEDAAHRQLTKDQARRVISDIYASINADRLESATCKDFLARWLEQKKREATGLRLSDVVRLTWQNIDLARGEVFLVTKKTSRRQSLPLAKPLQMHLETMGSSDDPTAPLFPRAYGTIMRGKNQSANVLSNQFYDLMASVGLVPARTHEKKKAGQGRDARRKINDVGFHALRHTATSLLKNAGVSDVVARDIIGHESAAVSRQYTHIDADTKRKALDAMPDLLK